MSALAILTNCPLANCPLAKRPLAKCLDTPRVTIKGNIPRISSYTWLFAKNTG